MLFAHASLLSLIFASLTEPEHSFRYCFLPDRSSSEKKTLFFFLPLPLYPVSSSLMTYMTYRRWAISIQNLYHRSSWSSTMDWSRWWLLSLGSCRRLCLSQLTLPLPVDQGTHIDIVLLPLPLYALCSCLLVPSSWRCSDSTYFIDVMF